MRSITTAAIPTAMTVAISSMIRLTTSLFFVALHTIGKLTAALVKDVRTVALPASEAVIFPCMAMVAAAAVVLALLTSPPNTPVANIP